MENTKIEGKMREVHTLKNTVLSCKWGCGCGECTKYRTHYHPYYQYVQSSIKNLGIKRVPPDCI